MKDKDKKDIMKAAKPRWNGKPTTAEPTEKYKKLNPRKFTKHKKQVCEADDIPFGVGDKVKIDPAYVKEGEKDRGTVEEITDSGYVTVRVGKKTRIYHFSDLSRVGHRMTDSTIESKFDHYLLEKKVKNNYKQWKKAMKELDCEFEDNMADSDDSDQPDDIELAHKDGVYYGVWNHTKDEGKIWRKGRLAEDTSKYFIVLAHAGRSNGSALVKAKNKAEARGIAKSYWLDTGKVDKVYDIDHEDVAWYLEDEEDKKKYMGEIEANIKKGQAPYTEIEWGT